MVNAWCRSSTPPSAVRVPSQCRLQRKIEPLGEPLECWGGRCGIDNELAGLPRIMLIREKAVRIRKIAAVLEIDGHVALAGEDHAEQPGDRTPRPKLLPALDRCHLGRDTQTSPRAGVAGRGAPTTIPR